MSQVRVLVGEQKNDRALGFRAECLFYWAEVAPHCSSGVPISAPPAPRSSAKDVGEMIVLRVALVTFLVLGRGEARAEDARALPTAGVDLEAMSDVCFKLMDGLALENRIVVRLIQDGYAVVSKSSDPEVLLQLSCKRKALRITEARTGQSQTLSPASLSLPQFHLLAGQAAVQLASASRPRQAPAPVAVPAPRPTLEPTPEPAPGPEAASAWRIAAGLGVLSRGVAADPRFTVDVSRQVGRLRPLLSVAYLPSRSTGIRVTELDGLLGVRHSFPLWRELTLGLRGCAGVRLHTFRIRETGVHPGHGAVTSGLVELGMMPTWKIAAHFRLGLDVSGSASASEIRHALDDEPIWTRSRWGTGAMLRLEWSV